MYFILFIKTFIYFAVAEKNNTFPGTENWRCLRFLFKYVHKTTEIRCQEKSRGGLSYEVILAEPAPNVAVPKRPVTPGKNVSVEEIDHKLKAAEERRISLEAKKMADISNKLAKVEEATRKKDEITNEFISQTKEQLESKMELHVEKREAIISDMKEKLKIHAQEIEKTRETLEQQKASEQKAIEEKLKIAKFLRDENIKKMLDRLKEHIIKIMCSN
ncbi:stathmin isoform X3 [Drosophila suzukii]|uniref:Stathmin isoform X3 n=1 Tax=Drosophila suzukii TaxID=28584 RepID=A0ABM4U014_DROSZ